MVAVYSETYLLMVLLYCLPGCRAHIFINVFLLVAGFDGWNVRDRHTDIQFNRKISVYPNWWL
jgi:hypothetical protein